MSTNTNELIRNWKKANTRQYLFYVNINKDPEVVEWLDSIPKRQQYLVNLVKENMHEKNPESGKTEDNK